jgi:uncharacterized membrane protein
MGKKKKKRCYYTTLVGGAIRARVPARRKLSLVVAGKKWAGLCALLAPGLEIECDARMSNERTSAVAQARALLCVCYCVCVCARACVSAHACVRAYPIAVIL